jgi:hypothetical protein
MRANGVAAALRESLGHEATLGLLDLFETEEEIWSTRMLSVIAERYERRLSEEIGGLRVALVREIHDARVETFKWAFFFSVGQVAAMAGLLTIIFRVTGR